MARFVIVTETGSIGMPAPVYAHSNLLKAYNLHSNNKIPNNYSFVYRKVRKDGYYSWNDGGRMWTVRKLVVY